MGETPSIRELSYFPFLKKAQDHIRNKYSSLDSLLEGEYGSSLVRHAIDRIRNALSFSKKYSTDGRYGPDEEIISYALARVIVSCLNDRQMIDRLTRYEAERAYFFLTSESDEDSWNNNYQETDSGFSRLFVYIADELGIPVTSECLPLTGYVELVAPMHEDRFRLVNRVVNKGEVMVDRDEMYELLRERIRLILRADLPYREVPVSICKRLAPALSGLQRTWQEQMLRQFGAIEESAFPPCIQALIRAITSGANLTHPGRFSLTAFLHNIGMEKSRIADLFARAPDFDAEKTMYQVSHITGGGGTEYNAPACAAMRTNSLCIRPDALCERVSHPLGYYKLKKKMQKYKKEEKPP